MPFWSVLTAPVLIGNDPVVAFAATITDPGIATLVRPVLLRLTAAPPDPAAFDSVTVQLPLAFASKVVRLHCRDEITGSASKDTVVESNVPLYVAVTVTF